MTDAVPPVRAADPIELGRIRRRPSIAATVRRLKQYAPGLLIEVLLLWTVLLAFQSLGYGGRVGVRQSASGIGLSLVLTALAWSAAEGRFRLYRRVWTLAGINDLIAIGAATAEAILLLLAANMALPGDLRPYRLAVPLLAAPAVMVLVGAYRLLPRLVRPPAKSGNRLLVVVFDSTGYPALRAVVQSPTPEWTPVAIVTVRPEQANHTVMGIPVVGEATHLDHWIKATRADGVAMVEPPTPTAEMREILGRCLAAELPIFVVPSVDDWFRRQSRKPFRQLSADDLVGRAQRQIEVEAVADLVRGKCVLVTGAAGSIGSELCRVIAGMHPERLVMVDNNESGLFDIAEEVRVNGTVDIREALVSVAEHDLMLDVFDEERPQIVFHAAAYKHVPMLESHPEQAALTNVLGTSNTIRCAEAVGVETFVLISTDKAVARHSVMGCTKRICELLVLSYRGPMACWAVRFGNVVGSRGSVVPTFERQIEQGGPVTITHPDVSRYMMTINEAVSLVVSTLRLGKPGHLYMLDMGEPIKIQALANALVRSRGLRPGTDIEIVYTGLRPGERLTEDILAEEEGWRPTAHPSIREVVSPCPYDRDDLAWTVERMVRLARDRHADALTRLLKTTVLITPRVDTTPTEEQVSALPSAPATQIDG